MPVQVGQLAFVKFRYEPDYLLGGYQACRIERETQRLDPYRELMGPQYALAS